MGRLGGWGALGGVRMQLGLGVTGAEARALGGSGGSVIPTQPCQRGGGGGGAALSRVTQPWGGERVAGGDATVSHPRGPRRPGSPPDPPHSPPPPRQPVAEGRGWGGGGLHPTKATGPILLPRMCPPVPPS